MADKIKLTYFPIRGRAEAIMLLLVDSGVSFEHETIAIPDWFASSYRTHGAPLFPFNGVPTLAYRDVETGEDVVLGETGAILQYLGQALRPPRREQRSVDGQATRSARLRMVEDASLFLTNRLPNFATHADWLGVEGRTEIMRDWVLPYLRSLEIQLKGPLFEGAFEEADQGQTTHEGCTTLLPAAVAACATISMICDIFPHSLDPLEGQGLSRHFPLCASLKKAVESRPRIKAWIDRGERLVEWTGRAEGKVALMRAAAEKWDREMDVESLMRTSQQ